MHIHRRQFTIGPRKFSLNENWKAYPVNCSSWLSCCPDLRVTSANDANGKNWLILGLAVGTLQKNISPEEEIRRTQSDRIPDLYSDWAGRWVLVGDGRLHLDASGLLGCFYGRDSQGRMWASSSAALIVPILFSDRPPVVDRRILNYEVGISWYTPPRSRFEGISRLLPSQVLDLRSGDVQHRPLMPEICLDRDYEDVLLRVQQILVTTLQQLAQHSPGLWLGLTAGYDSRLMLALSHFAGIPLHPFTRVSARMSVADRILPPKLAQACGYSHAFITASTRHSGRKRLAEEHTACHVSQGDAEPFVNGVRDGLTGISFGGHGFSVASGFARLHELPQSPGSSQTGARKIAQIFQEPVGSSAASGIQEWLSWVLDYPQKNLNWRDRFFIEQRQAGWLSSKEQLYDLSDLIRFPVLNCARLYSLLLSVRQEKRVGSRIQEDLIKRISPVLAEYPFNPDDYYFGPFQIVAAKSRELPGYVALKTAKKARWLLNLLLLRY